MAVLNRKTLVMERQTKGAILYSTKNGGADRGATDMITSIYLRKSGFPSGKVPGSIVVSVETDEDLS